MSLPQSFYYVRHGRTEANENGLMCGGLWDIDLSPTGEEQARQAAELFRRPLHTPRPTVMLVSPLLRARSTAAHLNRSLELELFEVPELREWEFGEWDTQPFEKCKTAFFGEEDPPGGETRAEFRRRVALGFAKAATYEAPPLIVAHGAVWLMLQTLLGLPPVRTENCVPYFLTHTEGSPWHIRRVDGLPLNP